MSIFPVGPAGRQVGSLPGPAARVQVAFSSRLQGAAPAGPAGGSQGVSGREVLATVLGNGPSAGGGVYKALASGLSALGGAVGGPLGGALGNAAGELVGQLAGQAQGEAEHLKLLEDIRTFMMSNAIFDAANAPIVERD